MHMCSLQYVCMNNIAAAAAAAASDALATPSRRCPFAACFESRIQQIRLGQHQAAGAQGSASLHAETPRQMMHGSYMCRSEELHICADEFWCPQPHCTIISSSSHVRTSEDSLDGRLLSWRCIRSLGASTRSHFMASLSTYIHARDMPTSKRDLLQLISHRPDV